MASRQIEGDSGQFTEFIRSGCPDFFYTAEMSHQHAFSLGPNPLIRSKAGSYHRSGSAFALKGDGKRCASSRICSSSRQQASIRSQIDWVGPVGQIYFIFGFTFSGIFLAIPATVNCPPSPVGPTHATATRTCPLPPSTSRRSGSGLAGLIFAYLLESTSAMLA
jgi:hypothetical protein